MRTTSDYLREAKKALGVSSDYALARELGLTRAAVSHYSCGRRVMDDDTALKVAEAIGVHPIEVLAAAHAERARTAEQRGLWEKVMREYGGKAAALLLAAGLYGSPAPSQASVSTSPILDSGIFRRRCTDRPMVLCAAH